MLRSGADRPPPGARAAHADTSPLLAARCPDFIPNLEALVLTNNRISNLQVRCACVHGSDSAAAERAGAGGHRTHRTHRMATRTSRLLQDIEPLVPLSKLTMLSLAGNPLVTKPNYRWVALMPRLGPQIAFALCARRRQRSYTAHLRHWAGAKAVLDPC